MASPDPGDALDVERKVIASTLDVVVHDFLPRAAAFIAVDRDGESHLIAADAPGRSPRQTTSEVEEWVTTLRGIDPLSPARLGRDVAPVATLADVGGTENVLRRPFLKDAYRRIGAVNEALMVIRDEDRLIAGVTLWRGLDGAPWGSRVLERLAALQPLVELAYATARRVASAQPDRQMLPALTRRQREVTALLRRGAGNREVARALGISESTARSHTRAVMAELGVSSRREVVLRLSRD